MGTGSFLSAAVLLLGTAVPVVAEPAPLRPGPVAEMVIALAVADALCSGRHGAMVARYRPEIMQRRAAELRQIGPIMAGRYRQAYGDKWAETLNSDLIKVRNEFEQQADGKAFCKQAALKAREQSGNIESAIGSFRGLDVENDLIRRFDRIR